MAISGTHWNWWRRSPPICAHGDGLLDEQRSQPADELHARRSARVSCAAGGAGTAERGAFASVGAPARWRGTSSNKPGGKVLVFLGGKGGSGVTTVACNFAVSLVQECAQSAVLIDLDLPLGDAALNLGISTAVLDRGRAAELHPPGSELSLQAADQAQFGAVCAGGAGQVSPGGSEQRGDGEAGRGGAHGISILSWSMRDRGLI